MIGARVGIFTDKGIPFEFGNCLQFDGINDYINWASSVSLTGQFTISFWYRPATLPTGGGLMTILGRTGSFAYGIYENASYQWNFRLSTINAFTFTAESLDTWYYYTITRDASNVVRFYRNAVESVTGGITQSGTFIFDKTQYNTITTYIPLGRLDELAVWDGVALSGAEISSQYNGGSGAFATDLYDANIVLYTQFNETSGTTAADSSASGNNATLNNFTGTYWVAH